MATLAIPEFGMRVQAETPGPPVCEPDEPWIRTNRPRGRLRWKGRYTGSMRFSGAPDSTGVRSLLLSDPVPRRIGLFVFPR
jgi:hypothetical protein